MGVYEDPLQAYAFSSEKLSWLVWLTGLTKLPAHLHEVLGLLVVYTTIYKLSKYVSPLLVPEYRNLSRRTQINFDMHIVSQFQAVLVCTLSAFMFGDSQLSDMRSYTPYAGFVVAAISGYFVWDAIVCYKYRRLFGLGFLAHALAALFTFMQSYRPVLLNYAATFVWYEASTPFVNVHWFSTHVKGLVSSRVQIINGFCLLAVFFVIRIVLGPYHSLALFREGFRNPPQGIPFWVLPAVLLSNLTLNLLNFFWFSKMVRLAKGIYIKASKET